MNINPTIINILDKETSNKDLALLYMCAIYFSINVESNELFNDKFITKINLLKIFEKDYFTNQYKWNIPLFTNWKIEIDFIEEYRDLFRSLDVTKANDRQTIVKKMETFITDYPMYTKKDILEATKMYIEDYANNNSNSVYLQNAKYFIKKERNPEGSKLLEWLEIMKKEKERYYD